jgi:uroporphyrinogen decarboxylase
VNGFRQSFNTKCGSRADHHRRQQCYRHQNETLSGIESQPGHSGADDSIYDWPELGTARVDEETLLRLHGDARGVLDRFPKEVTERNQKLAPHAPFIDDWGGGQTEIEPGVWFPGSHPLANATTLDELERYPSGGHGRSLPVAQAALDAKRLAEENEYAILATPWLMFPFERAFAMQGMDKFLMNMALYPDFAEALLRKNLELCKRQWLIFWMRGATISI